MHVIDRVRRTIRRRGLAAPDTRVVAAVSGGSDSVALACILHALDAAGELRLVALAHLDHGLRPTSPDDEALCRALAARLDRPFASARTDVGADARARRRSIEVAARQARYAFLEDIRTRHHADVIALGHTRDDQAETYLLRLLRGAGPRGLASMHPRAGHMVRPLLDCRRADLRGWLQAEGVPFADDETNADVRIPRNRVRAELLPVLARRFNPAIVEALSDQAELAREAWQWFDAEADALGATTPLGPRTVGLDLIRLATTPAALRRYVVWRALSRVAGGRTVGFEHVDAALSALEADSDTGIDLPGCRLQRTGAAVVLTGRPDGNRGRLQAEPANLFRYLLSIPGEVLVSEAGCRVVASTGEWPGRPTDAEATVALDGDLVRGPLTVRNRRPGDRFQPPGMAGHKRVQDLFVDRKVPRAERDRVPIVVDADDRVVWVAGHGVDAAFQPRAGTKAVIFLRIELLGGLA